MHNLRKVSVTQARKDLGNIFGEVSYQKERIVLTNHKKCVAIVPIEDLEAIEAMENKEDIRQAKLALKEIKKKGTISSKEMKKRLA